MDNKISAFTYIKTILGIIISIIVIDSIFSMKTDIQELKEEIDVLKENSELTMEFSVLQAEKIDLLEAQCSDSAKQIAIMCAVCTEKYQKELTESIVIIEEELQSKSVLR